MYKIVFEFAGLHEHGSAYFDYLALRKRFFVDQLGWDIPHNDRFEMDQYDNPTAWYALVVEDGEVLGGARVAPTTSSWGKHTYMMRDAFEGRIDSIPKSSLPDNVASDQVWEMTRLVMSDSVHDAVDRRTCLQLVCDGCIDIVQSHGCQELRAMSSVAMLRVLRQVGYPVDRLGSTWRDPGDGRQYSAMKMDIPQVNLAMAAE